jgi:hypothetical protein
MSQDRIAFVSSLELPDSPALSAVRLGLPNLIDDQPAALVDDGSVVSFVADLSAEHQSDVLNSTLLAQLAANKKYDRWTKTVDWYKYYVDVLGGVGWVIQEFDFTKFDSQGNSFSVDKVLMELLAAIATQNQLAIALDALKALKALSDDDHRLELFNSASHSTSNGNFQIGTCSEAKDNVAMSVACFSFDAKQIDSKFLWFSYSASDMSLFKASQSVSLDEEIYAGVRKAVVTKLGENAKTLVANLDI